MRTMRWRFCLVALALPLSCAAAGPRAATEVSPTAEGPGANAAGSNPAVGAPGAGVSAPGLGGNTALVGIPVPSGASQGSGAAVPSAGAASVLAATPEQAHAAALRGAPSGAAALPTGMGASAPKATVAVPSSEAGASAAASDGGLRPARPRGDESRATTVPGGLSGLGTSLRESQKAEAKGADGATGHTLSRTYENEGERPPNPDLGLSGSVVAGREQTVQAAVRQLSVVVAAAAQPRDQPAIYQRAIAIAAEAALNKRITPAQFTALVQEVLATAWERAADAVTKLEDEAYAAAMKGEDSAAKLIESNFQALGAWEKLLRGGDSRSLVRGHPLAELRARVLAFAQSKSRQPEDSDAVAPRTRFAREGSELVVISLPELAAPGVVAQSPIPEVAQDSMPAALDVEADGLQAIDSKASAEGLWARAQAIYRFGRRAGRAVPKAAWTATAFVVKSAARSVWGGLWDALTRAVALVFPGRVDLGAGQQLVAGDRELSRLAELRRKPTAQEEALLSANLPGARAVFLDLSALNREAEAAERLAARGALTVGQLRSLLDSLERLSGRLERLSGDGSAAAAAASLRRRAAPALALPDASLLPEPLAGLGDPTLPGGLAYWIGQAKTAELDAIDRKFESAMRRSGLSAIAYSDLSQPSGSMARLVMRGADPAAMAQLQGLGFEIEAGAGGVARAWATGPRLAERLRTALEILSIPAPAAASAEDVARAASQAAAHPDEARRQAELLLAEDPQLQQMSDAGLVTVGGVEYRARSVVGGGKITVALREPQSGRWLAAGISLPKAAGRH